MVGTKRGVASESVISYMMSLARRAMPLVLGSLSTYLISFADHFMTRGLGRPLLSGIYLSNQLTQFITYLIIGVETAVAVRSAESARDGDARAYASNVRAGVLSALLITSLTTIICIFAPKIPLSLLGASGEILDTGVGFLRLTALSLLPYSVTRALLGALRARGDGAPTLISSLISLSLNLVLNALLIGGRLSVVSLGAIGAGVATLASRLVECAYVVICTIIKNRSEKETPYGVDGSQAKGTESASFASPSGKRTKRRNENIPSGEDRARALSFSLDIRISASSRGAGRGLFSVKRRTRSFISTLLPILAAQAVWGVSNLVVSGVITSFGSESAAALGVAGSLYALFFSVAGGFSAAAGVRTTRLTSRPEHSDGKRLRLHYFSSLILFTLVGACLSVLMIFLRPTFLRLYGITDSQLAESFVLCHAITLLPAYLATALSLSMLKSGGKELSVALADLGVLLLYTVPLALITRRLQLSPSAALLALRGEHLIKLVIAFVLSHRRVYSRIDKPMRV